MGSEMGSGRNGVRHDLLTFLFWKKTEEVGQVLKYKFITASNNGVRLALLHYCNIVW